MDDNGFNKVCPTGNHMTEPELPRIGNAEYEEEESE